MNEHGDEGHGDRTFIQHLAILQAFCLVMILSPYTKSYNILLVIAVNINYNDRGKRNAAAVGR